MEKIAVFPGSFDPITVGHQSIINRAINIFDKIIVAVGENSEKANFFSIEQRLKWIELVFANEDRIQRIQVFRPDRGFLQKGKCPFYPPRPANLCRL